MAVFFFGFEWDFAHFRIVTCCGTKDKFLFTL